MIDLKQELKDYLPIDFKSMEEGGSVISDNVKNSMVLYNKALGNLHSGNEDIAIIELKKAISMNPEFYEAMNLLGICYSETKEYSKASELFERIVEAEKNSVSAMKYLSQMSSNDTHAAVSEVRKKVKIDKAGQKAADNGAKKDTAPGISELEEKKSRKFNVNYVNFVIVVLVISAALSLYAHYKSSVKSFDNTKVTSVTTEESYKSKFDALSVENGKLKSELDTALSDKEYYQNTLALFQIEKLADDGKYEDAADQLLMMKTANFKDAEKEKLTNLMNLCMPRAAEAAFNEGNSLYGMKKYQEAAQKLNKVLQYGDGWNYNDNVMYYLGVCYKELDDSKNAIDIFQKLIDKYPKSNFAEYAGYRIKELTDLP